MKALTNQIDSDNILIEDEEFEDEVVGDDRKSTPIVYLNRKDDPTGGPPSIA